MAWMWFSLNVQAFATSPFSSSLAFADFGLLLIDLWLSLDCFQVEPFSKLVLFALLLQVLKTLRICFMDSYGPSTFASRMGTNV